MDKTTDKIMFRRENSDQWEEAINTSHLKFKLRGNRAVIIFPKPTLKQKYKNIISLLFNPDHKRFKNIYKALKKVML